MTLIRQELAEYGRKIAQRGLTAGAGGNISARDGRLIWVKPSGFAMEELSGKDMACVDLDSGRQIDGRFKPTSELPMHLAVYKRRAEIKAIFHTHSPWACGVISSGVEIQPMFAEVVADLGGVKQVPYIITGSGLLAEAVAEAAEENETIMMANHGVVTLGRTMKQAYYRACVAEDAAKSYVGAAIVGKPQFLSEDQIAELRGLAAGAYRTKIMESEVE